MASNLKRDGAVASRSTSNSGRTRSCGSASIVCAEWNEAQYLPGVQLGFARINPARAYCQKV